MCVEEISWIRDFDSFAVEHHRRVGQFHKRVHTHGAYEIYYLISGDRHYNVDGRMLYVKKGNVVLINPGTPHETLDAFAKAHERIMVNFTLEYITDVVKPKDLGLFDVFQMSPARVVELGIAEQAQVENLMRRIVYETRSNRRGRDTFLRVCLTELLICLQRNIADEKSTLVDQGLKSQVAGIAEYMRENYMQPLTLTQLAERFFVSPHYLCRVFKQVTGESFVGYLAHWRTEAAKTLLEQSALSVGRIAELVGYDNPIHFGRVFKAKTGYAPSQYRNQQRGMAPPRARAAVAQPLPIYGVAESERIRR